MRGRDRILQLLHDGPLTFDQLRAARRGVVLGQLRRLEEAKKIERVEGSDPVQWRRTARSPRVDDG